MSICMMCHKPVPKGVRFCDNCQLNIEKKADESYLDGLLDSVTKNPKKQPDESISVSEFSDMTDTPVSDKDSMLADLLAEMDDIGFGDGTDEPVEVESDIEEDDLENIFNEAAGSMNMNMSSDVSEESQPDDLFDISDDADDSVSGMDILDEIGSLSDIDGESADFATINEELMPDDFDASEEENPDGSISSDEAELTDGAGLIDEAELNDISDLSDGIDINEVSEPLSENVSGPEADVDSDFDALFSEVKDDGMIDITGTASENPEQDNPDEEIDKLLDEISKGDFYNEDEKEKNSDNSSEASDKKNTKEKKKKEKKNKVRKESSKEFSDNIGLSEEELAEASKNKKRGFFARLFGNVVEEKTPEQIEEEKQREAKAEQDKIDKANKKKRDAEEKKKKAAEDKEKAKADAEAAKAKKAAEQAAKKAEAKEKAKQKKEAALALAQYEIEHGRINRVGATILFVIFAILTIFIIIGTNIYSYNLSIKNAQTDFEQQKYNEAYYEVYGLNIQDEDIELYDRIMTVMYVNAQLNSYQYYMKSNSREKALDSLLKGLQRYDKYLQLAIRLNIKDDLNMVRSQIINELSNEFKLSESQAYDMIVIDDKVDYSDGIYFLLGDYDTE